MNRNTYNRGQLSGEIWIAGDSIAAYHKKNGYQVPTMGWGVYIREYLPEGVTVHNEARSGRSSRSYLREENYRKIMDHLAEDDILFIGFGLNDLRSDFPGIYTDARGDSDFKESYSWYLKNYYVEPALQAGAYPVLLSPVATVYEKPAGIFTNESQKPYAEAVEKLYREYTVQKAEHLARRKTAKCNGVFESGTKESVCMERSEKHLTHNRVFYIDLYKLTEEWFQKIGDRKIREYHGIDQNGCPDPVHFSEAGARKLAVMIWEEVEKYFQFRNER